MHGVRMVRIDGTVEANRDPGGLMILATGLDTTLLSLFAYKMVGVPGVPPRLERRSVTGRIPDRDVHMQHWSG